MMTAKINYTKFDFYETILKITGSRPQHKRGKTLCALRERPEEWTDAEYIATHVGDTTFGSRGGGLCTAKQVMADMNVNDIGDRLIIPRPIERSQPYIIGPKGCDWRLIKSIPTQRLALVLLIHVEEWLEKYAWPYRAEPCTRTYDGSETYYTMLAKGRALEPGIIAAQRSKLAQ